MGLYGAILDEVGARRSWRAVPAGTAFAAPTGTAFAPSPQ
jgi:hypothetical protein